MKDRKFAVCFGYGSTTLDWSAIETNFGLKFAARRLDPNRAKRTPKQKNRRVEPYVKSPVGIGAGGAWCDGYGRAGDGRSLVMVRCLGQVGMGSGGIQGLPVMASWRTSMALWPCLMAVET